MMRRFIMIGSLLMFGTGMQAKADSINFADKTGPTMFDATTGPQTITEGLATFTGGVMHQRSEHHCCRLRVWHL